MRNGLTHLITSAIFDFKRNKVRTFLTSLGIMIGVLSVVMLIALGLGLKNYIKQQFESLGANLVIIMPGSMFSGEGGLAGSFDPASMFGGSVQLDERDVNSLRVIEEVDYIAPLTFNSMFVEIDGNRSLAYIMGTNEDFFKIMTLDLIAGEEFSRSEVQSRARVAVMGHTIAEDLFGRSEDAIGRIIRLPNQRFRIIGVAKRFGDREMDNSITIPYTTAFTTGISRDRNFFSIYLGISSDDNVDPAKEKAKEVLSRRYDEDDFSITSQDEILSAVNQVFAVLNAVLVAIGSISLLVGGIGIMNIMYATVTERTKEIGIRRAVGATEKDVLNQFLTEAVILSGLGGVVGLLLASIIVLIVRPHFPVSINLLAVIIAFAVSSAIGIFFGVFPARRAAKLPPIEAIRYE